MDLKCIYKKKDNIIARRIADEMLLVPVKGELASMHHLFALNPVAELIWIKLDGECDLQAVLKAILDSYDINPEEAKKHLFEFIHDLSAAQLIEPVL